jgi:hypothetical protein
VSPCYLKKRKNENENRRYKTEWEEEFVFVERNHIKYFIRKSNIVEGILWREIG